jgi:hypothetical protein
MFQSINVLTASGASIQECATELRTDIENGLPTAEANRRLQFTGYNEFDMSVKESLLSKYVEQVGFTYNLFTNHFSLKIR